MAQATDKKTYPAIDGLRAIAAIGILMMHIAANTNYQIEGYIYKNIIPSFTDFTFLFMLISAFGMCCGYYEKVRSANISYDDFYAKRFKKILPFFALLVLIDVIISPSLSALYDAFADITLLFGFLPEAGNIQVIGVGWFIGLCFVFYLCFPFFCTLIKNKKCAWTAFAISLVYNLACAEHFGVGRNNILYSACYFLAGGLIYLYKNELEELAQKRGVRLIMLTAVAVGAVAYFALGANTLTRLFLASSLLIYAVMSRGKVLQNKAAHFLSGISMEIYLSHMVIFRVVEKLGLHQIIKNGWLQYFITVAVVLAGAIIFSTLAQKLIAFAEKSISRRINKID